MLGKLTWDAPIDQRPDRYVYDPRNPIVVEGLISAYDRRPIERRDDLLVYTTEPLTEPIEVIGRIFVTLSAASDARDTDFIAHLLDVYPDGRAITLLTAHEPVLDGLVAPASACTEVPYPASLQGSRIRQDDRASMQP